MSRHASAPHTHPVWLVGAGPGDAELLTIKAARVLAQADVILIDDLVDRSALTYARADVRLIEVGKRGGCQSTSQAFINRLLVREALSGARVVRLKGGDPFVFGRGAEEADALRAAGLEVRVIPGITAGVAAPSTLGIAVTDRRHARGVAFVTGHSQYGGERPHWPSLARSGLTLVIYMGVKHCAQICEELIAGGLAPHTPAAVIASAHTPRQRSHLTTLAQLAADIQRLGLARPAILVIGDVVAGAHALGQSAASMQAQP